MLLALFLGGLVILAGLVFLLMAAPTITSTYQGNLTIQETPNIFGSSGTVTLAPMNTTETLTGASTPAVSAATSYQAALVSGTLTIDLTSLPGLEPSDTVTFLGLKVQHCKLQNPAGNANNITIAPGGANPYNLFGATFSITLAPGQEVMFRGNNATPAVASGAKTLLVTGTGTQALNVEMSAG